VKKTVLRGLFAVVIALAVAFWAIAMRGNHGHDTTSAIAAASTAVPASAAATAANNVTASIPVPTPPPIEARAYVLMDYNSGDILAQGNARERMEPASLTKLMTAYVVFSGLADGKIHLDDQVFISKRAWQTGGSRTFADVNTRIPLDDLLKGMIVQSGNDASVALAEHVAGSEEAFAELMNHYAASLGMTGTHFMNATGLPDPDHYTTAYDIALLAQAIIRQFPEYYRYYSIKEFSYNGITQHNRNKLLWRDPTVDGMKTGYTESAGYCLVTSSLRDGMRLITVVLGTKDEEARVVESQKLLGYGFRFFETKLLYAASSPITRTRVWRGEVREIPLGITKDLYVTVPRDAVSKIASATNVNPTVLAPVHKGDQLGSIEVKLDGADIVRRPLVAMQDVPEGGFTRRVADRIAMLFQ
jgi:D-alanyl-D-alanine carboxypeptidase (penicillin-binding protein 5/6)